MPERRLYPVSSGLSGGRIDSVLSRMIGLSRGVCIVAVQKGEVWIDGVVTSKLDRVPSGAVLEIPVPDPPSLRLRPSAEGVVRLYEDEDVIIVNKPAGMAAHPSLNFEGPDVLGTLMAEGVKLTTHGPQERKGIVHRLDIGTTGCMVVTKSEAAYLAPKHASRNWAVEKVYHALVQDYPDPMSGTTKAPIGRDDRRQWKMAVRVDEHPSVIHYEALEVIADTSLLEIRLKTGRIHQIRVHMSAMLHPYVGDDMYGADPTLSARLDLTWQWLHAVRLGSEYPTSGEWVIFATPCLEGL